MTYIMSYRGLKRCFILLFAMSLCLTLSSTQAQDVTPTEPLPESTEVVNETPIPEPSVVTEIAPTEPTAAPTDEIVPAPTEPGPVPTQEITAEPLPTEEAAPIPTSEVIPTEAVAPVITPEEVIPAPLPLTYSDSFDTSPGAAWTVSGEWLPVALDDGQGVQAGDNASLTYAAASFVDVNLDTRLFLRAGTLVLILRQDEANRYEASLSASGHAELLKNGVVIAASDSAPVSETWVDVQFGVIGSTVSLSVNGTVLTAADTSPLAQGAVVISTGKDTLLRLDSVAISGVPLAPVVQPVIPPPPQSDPPMTAPTAFKASVNLPTSITLTWTDGANESEYRLERYNTVSSLWEQIAAPVANATSYSDLSYSCGTTRQYRLRGYRHISADEFTVYTAVAIGKTPPCPAPALVFPAPNQALDYSTPELSWTGLANITEYQIDLSMAASFTPHVSGYPKLVTGTTHLVASLPDGTYYWHVRAASPSSGPFSTPPRAFTIDTVSPAAPIPLSPANVTIMRTPRPTFSWSGVPGATKYDLVLDDNDDFGSPVSLPSTNLSATTFFVPTNLAQGRYYWHVIARDAAGNESTPSVTVEVIINPALTPAPNTVIPTTGAAANVEFKWAAGAPGATTYTVQLDEAVPGDFGTLLPQTCPTSPTTALKCTINLPKGAYVWRVLRNGETPVGTVITSNLFYVSAAAPRPPRLVAPVNNRYLLPSEHPNVALSWDWGAPPAVEPPGGAFKYTVEISKSGAFDTTPVQVYEGITVQNKLTDPLQDGTYFWRVRAVNQYGVTGAWSGGFRFVVDSAPPGSVMVLGPTGTVPTVRPTFRWLPSEGAHRYEIKLVAEGSACSATALYLSTALITGTSYTIPPASPALSQGAYQICIRAYDLSQNPSDYVEPYSFRIFVGALTAGPVLTAPNFNDLFNAPSLNLTWNPATPPAGLTITDYEIIISNNATPVPPFVEYPPFVSAGGTLQYEFTPAEPVNHVTYYWYVRGVSNGLPVTNWSSSRFILDHIAPDKPVMIWPLNNDVINTARPKITWKPVPGAVSYSVEIFTDPGSYTVEPFAWSAGDITGTSVIPDENLPQAPMTLLVTAYDGINWGQPAFIEVFQVRLGTKPAVTANLTTTLPTFTWEPVPGATEYVLQIDDDRLFDFTNEDITETDGVIITIPVPASAAPSYTLTGANPLPGNGVYYWRVSHNGPHGGYPAFIGSRLFTVNTPVGKPTNLISKNKFGDVDVYINAGEENPVTLFWTEPSPPPLGYNVQLASDSAFNTIIGGVTIGGSSYGFNSLSEGPKYWRVRGYYSADGLNVTPWSETALFTIDRTPPGVPAGNLPPNNTYNSSRPTFTWSESTGAVKYHIMITDNAPPQPVLYDNVVVGTTFVWPPSLAPLLQNSTKYTWHLAAEDAAGNVANVSSGYIFSIFVGLQPALDQLLTDTTPTFTWTNVTGLGAGAWTLQVDDNVGMSSPLSVDLPATASSYTLTPVQALLSGQHFWRVVRAGEVDANIPPRSFWISGNLNTLKPTQIAPANGVKFNAAQVSAGLVFNWTPVKKPGTTDDITSYVVQISRAPNFPQPLYATVASSDASHSQPWTGALAQGTYYWRVVPYVGTVANPATASAVRSFLVDTLPPAAPLLNGPIANARITATRTPSFSWSVPGGGPTRYVFQLSTSPTFSTIRYQATVTAPNITLPPSQALPNGTYYWRVTARDAVGNPVDLPAGGTSATSLSRSLLIAVP